MTTYKGKTRILLVINKTEREIRTMERIRYAVLDLDPNASVEIKDIYKADFIQKLLEFEPTVVLTFPFTGIGLSSRFYVMKYLLKFNLVCFRTEGVFDLSSKKLVDLVGGLDDYGSDLVDYELFWGKETAEVIGRRLLEQAKISSPERVRFFGHPLFEQYFQRPGSLPVLPGELGSKIGQFIKDKTVLFVTGFHWADYSKEDVINAKDLVNPKAPDFEKHLQEYLEDVEKVKIFRQMWIETIIETAHQNPDALLVVKSHPVENDIFNYNNICNPYKIFNDYTNILYISKGVSIAEILPFCSLFLHYGSTTALESYCSRVPSVYITSRALFPIREEAVFSEAGFPSIMSADIMDVPRLVRQHLTSPIGFELNESTERSLEALLNIKRDRAYTPSRDIAEFLLAIAHDNAQRISKTDPFLANVIKESGTGVIRLLLRQGVDELRKGKLSNAVRYCGRALRLLPSVDKRSLFRGLSSSLLKRFKVKSKELAIRLLANGGYALVRRMPRPKWAENTSRFEYQRLFNNFEILPGSVVLDVGSGADPFPLATILTDRFLETTHHRTEQIVLDGRTFLLSDIENLPFADKAVDFVYCSHLLEHVEDPLQACGEIVRIGKRGYIETPTLGKDMLFSWAKGMHRWHIMGIANRLIFFEYSERQLAGVRSDIWTRAIFAPYRHPMQDVFYNNPDVFNVMFSWDVGFDCVVYYLNGNVEQGSLK